jgi:TetR/AcrR family transcriptional regulator, regulator of mycofactocin system
MPSMDTSSTRVSVTSSELDVADEAAPASLSILWFGSMTLPFVRFGGSTFGVDVVRISDRIWHRVPEWKGGIMAQQPRVGRRRSTTREHISDVALGLFAERGFSDVSVDDVAHATGIARRSVFRYYASKNAIPWGDFDAHLQHLRELLDRVDPGMPLGEALRAALLSFNTFDESETVRHRQRMRVILQTAELQAYSMTMYAGWREVIAGFVARRTGAKTTDLQPQTVAWMMLGVALSAYEHWLDDQAVSLTEALGDAFDVVRAGLKDLDRDQGVAP